MAKRFTQHVELNRQIIAASYEVHNTLGPGLLEQFYRDALMHELLLLGLKVDCEKEFVVEYKQICRFESKNHHPNQIIPQSPNLR